MNEDLVELRGRMVNAEDVDADGLAERRNADAISVQSGVRSLKEMTRA